MATDTQPPADARTLTALQICKRLQISRWTLNKLREAEDFPCPVIAIHQCVRWSAKDIDDWMASQTTLRPAPHGCAGPG